MTGRADYLALGEHTTKYGPKPRTVAERFWKYVDKKATADCWRWTGAKNQHGYGRLNINNNPIYAHRISWELHNGKLSEYVQVLHICDNPSCVNPLHLSLGTQIDNMHDCKLKERNVFVITLEDAETLRRTYAAQSLLVSKMKLQEELALRYKISTRTVRYIISGERR